jgi:hypothetical protein
MKPPADRLAAMIACAERELAMRKKAYPRWVNDGRMTQAKADAEIALMGEIAATLKALTEPEPEVQTSLFGGAR